MSIDQEYANDRYWIEALRHPGHDEEVFQKGKRLKENIFTGLNSSGKMKRDEPTKAKIMKKSKYIAMKKRVYQAKQKGEKVDKGKPAPWQKMIHRVWADVHKALDQKIVDQRKVNG